MCANHTTNPKARQGAGEAGPMGLSLTQQLSRAPKRDEVPKSPEGPSSFDQAQASGHVVVLDHDLSRLARMKHHVRTATRLLVESIGRAKAKTYPVFLTLTYRDGADWKPEHVSDFIRLARKWFARRGHPLRYVWVAETQQRGAIHYHAVLYLPSGLRIPKPDECGWWPHGASNVQGVKANATGYLMKYVSKGTEKPLPKGARVCGSGGLDDEAKAEFHYWRQPRYVREHMTIGDRADRVEGGGRRVRGTDQVHKSAFGVAWHAKAQGRHGSEMYRAARTTLLRVPDWLKGVEHYALEAFAARWDMLRQVAREVFDEEGDKIRRMSHEEFRKFSCTPPWAVYDFSLSAGRLYHAQFGQP